MVYGPASLFLVKPAPNKAHPSPFMSTKPFVVPDLRFRRVHHSEATAVHVETRAETAEKIHEEGRDGEAGRIATRLPDAVGRVARLLTVHDPRAGRVGVAAGDTEGVVAARGRIFRGDGEDGRDRPRGEGERLAVGHRKRAQDAGLLSRAAVSGVGAQRIATRARTARAEPILRRTLLADVRTFRGDELVGPRDAVPRHDGLTGDVARYGTTGRGGACLTGGPRIADERQRVLVNAPRFAAR